MAHQFPDNDDYKRGLVDMLKELTITNGKEVRSAFSQNTILNSADSPIIALALDYIEQQAEKAKLADMIKTLHEAGYRVMKPGDVMMSTDQMIDALNTSGFIVQRRGVAEPTAPSLDEMAAILKGNHYAVLPPGDSHGVNGAVKFLKSLGYQVNSPPPSTPFDDATGGPPRAANKHENWDRTPSGE